MKTKPYGVRFDEELLKKIQDRENLPSPQKVVNFLMKWYEQLHFPISANPVYERNTDKGQAQVIERHIEGFGTVGVLIPGGEPPPVPRKSKNVPRETSVEQLIGKFKKVLSVLDGEMPPAVAEEGINVSISPLPEEKAKLERIKQLQHEIDNPPVKFTSDLAKKSYFHDRNKELKQLRG